MVKLGVEVDRMLSVCLVHVYVHSVSGRSMVRMHGCDKDDRGW